MRTQRCLQRRKRLGQTSCLFGRATMVLFPWGRPVQDPLGVGYLAAYLRAEGYSVRVLDAHALDLDNNGLVACVNGPEPPLDGALTPFLRRLRTLRWNLARGKGRASERLLCIRGGEHATFHANNILEQHPEVDAVAMGEGEATLAALLAAIRHEQPQVEGRLSLDAPVAGALARGKGGALLHPGVFAPPLRTWTRSLSLTKTSWKWPLGRANPSAFPLPDRAWVYTPMSMLPPHMISFD